MRNLKKNHIYATVINYHRVNMYIYFCFKILNSNSFTLILILILIVLVLLFDGELIT